MLRYSGPARFVILSRCLEQPPCSDDDECIEAVQNIQAEHMDERRLDDIAWSFLVGGNDKIYAGRGFQVSGEHTPGKNDHAVGICCIGPGNFKKVILIGTLLDLKFSVIF